MAIRESIVLEGDDVVIQKLNNIQKQGEASLKSFRDLSKGDTGNPFESLIEGAKKAGIEVQQTTQHTVKFGTALRGIGAISKLVGADIGGIGAAARLAGGSLGVLAPLLATVGAAVAAGFEEEKIARLQGTLADVFGSAAKGKEAFNALGKSAQTFGTSVSDLAQPLESLQTALNNVDRSKAGFVALRAEDLPGANIAQDVKASTQALENFLKILRAGRLTQDEAQKAAKAFFDTLRDGGPVASAALRALPVGTLTLLKEAIGAAGLSSKEFFEFVDRGSLTTDKLVASLQKFGPEAQRAFDAKAVKTIGDEFGKVLATMAQGFQKLSGVSFSQGIIKSLELINKALQATNDLIQGILDKDAELKGAALLRLTGGVAAQPTLEQLIPPGVAPFPTPEQAGKAGDNAGEAFNKSFAGKVGFVDVSQALQGAGDRAGALFGKSFLDNQFFKNLPQEINEALPEEKRQILLKPVISDAELEAQGLAAGSRLFTKLKEGIDQQPPPEFPGILTGLETAGNAVTAKAQELWNRIKQIIEQQINFNIGFSGGGGGNLPPLLAGGGRVRGPGSTTSDSILAFLSNREFVVNAKAVDFYGSSLFAALNSMRLPRNLIAAPQKFAEGGQAQATGSALTLVLGGRQFEARASEGTVTALRRFAVNSQLASIGRKPGFVR